MFGKYRLTQSSIYHASYNTLSSNPELLIRLEQYVSSVIRNGISFYYDDIRQDYDEASYLYPFWQNYPPDNRGRQPVGDQYPWIEVGEHSVGDKIYPILRKEFDSVRSVGLPTGPDERFAVTSDKILALTNGLTSSCWIMVDIKSAGPRDNFGHTVMSHNQISGSGGWDSLENGIVNHVMKATGKHTSHDFYASLPPLFVLSDKTILPVVTMAIKPIYSMLRMAKYDESGGQPLEKIELVSIPNGILLEVNPNYLKQYPGLIFPGKDDKGKNPRKIRARVDFAILKKIGEWRVLSVTK